MAKLTPKIKSFGAMIANARVKAGMTQEQLADRMGLQQAISICKWETGTQAVALNHLLGLHHVLNIPVQTLLDYARAFDPLTVEAVMGLKDLAERKKIDTRPVIDTRPIQPILETHPEATMSQMIQTALQIYAERALFAGIDPNTLRPIILKRDGRGKLIEFKPPTPKKSA